MEAPLWEPSNERIAGSQLTRFKRFVTEQRGLVFESYPALHQWSVTSPEDFWNLFWQFANVIHSRPASSIMSGDGTIRGTRWFEGARLNFAENLLRRTDQTTAISAWVEGQHKGSLSFAQLRSMALAFGGSLQSFGISSTTEQSASELPDRVAAIMPNIPETIVAMLGTTSLGAIWSSCSPDFGAQGIIDRFAQIAPRVLIAVDAYQYAGKLIDLREKLATVTAELPSLERVIVVSSGLVAPLSRNTLTVNSPKCRELVYFEELLKHQPLSQFAQLPFDHPLVIMYSSGTTGVPKCIVHGAGGTLLQLLKEHQLHTNISSQSKLFYFTTCGWMMWNWLINALASEGSLVLYDGSPFHPSPAVLWEMAEREQITAFGTSAKYLAALEKTDYRPGASCKLDTLQTILSTGSPLLPQSFDFVYRHIKSDLQLASISGGTDIVSCFALGNPTLPVYRSELQCLGLGMNVKIFNDLGKPIIGEPGELVCLTPFPSRPLYFWNDPDGSKYFNSYFDSFSNVWRHGDWAEETPHHGLIMHGRSDTVLKPGGVRIGTAELYRAVERISEVAEALAIGQQWQGDERIVLFVRLQPGFQLTEELVQRIKQTIRADASPRHVPAKIIAVPDIPRTISGKIVELAVKHLIHQRPVKNVHALANPESLRFFENLPELQS